MPIVYKLINPITNNPYYVGFTTQPIKYRLVQHLYKRKYETTKSLISTGNMPIIEIIVQGDTVTLSDEKYWIKELSKIYKLENNRKNSDGNDIETARNIIKTLKVGKSINVKVASLTNFRSYLSYLNTENKLFNTKKVHNEVFVFRLN